MPSVGSLGEDGLVAGVIAGLGAHGLPGWLTVGPGDDAAVADWSALGGGGLVASTDTLADDEDFRQHWSSPADVGVKVAAQNFADIAAMGARPAMLLVSLALPAGTDVAFSDGLAEGLALECARAGAVVAGGDVSQARQIVITGTAIGVLEPGRAPVLRSGARPGDVVAVAGDLGRAHAGWALLEHGFRNGTGEDDAAAALVAALGPEVRTVISELIAVQQRPQPPYAAGPVAAQAGATALIDTSDGLLRDAGRIAAASGVTIELDGGALAPAHDLRMAADLLDGASAVDWVLTGGEDHALLACFPAGIVIPAGFAVIGAVRAGGSEVLVDGERFDGSPGWRHFR